ncbi:MAG: septum formation initiator family protein [Oscillospiraceae bacterium]|jgi:cell division protein FtsB|nr:septum formation initiator family protein [Oscillospiraceae bacterium]
MRRKKKRRILFKAMVVMMVLYAAVRLVMAQVETNAQLGNIANLTAQLEEQRETNAALRSLNDSLSDKDDDAIVQIARDVLGYVYPDEKVIVNVGR